LVGLQRSFVDMAGFVCLIDWLVVVWVFRFGWCWSCRSVVVLGVGKLEI
jgi:hypothetical protein